MAPEREQQTEGEDSACQMEASIPSQAKTQRVSGFITFAGRRIAQEWPESSALFLCPQSGFNPQAGFA